MNITQHFLIFLFIAIYYYDYIEIFFYLNEMVAPICVVLYLLCLRLIRVLHQKCERHSGTERSDPGESQCLKVTEP